MPNSHSWSTASAPCRIEWRASRIGVALLATLGALAAFAALACEWPVSVGIPLSLAAGVQGLRLAHAEWRRPPQAIVVPGGGGAVTVDGAAVEDFAVEWRGPFAFLRWRGNDGRVRYRCGWPGALDACTRRELRLAMALRAPAPGRASMAP